MTHIQVLDLYSSINLEFFFHKKLFFYSGKKQIPNQYKIYESNEKQQQNFYDGIVPLSAFSDSFRCKHSGHSTNMIK